MRAGGWWGWGWGGAEDRPRPSGAQGQATIPPPGTCVPAAALLPWLCARSGPPVVSLLRSPPTPSWLRPHGAPLSRRPLLHAPRPHSRARFPKGLARPAASRRLCPGSRRPSPAEVGWGLQSLHSPQPAAARPALPHPPRGQAIRTSGTVTRALTFRRLEGIGTCRRTGSQLRFSCSPVKNQYSRGK